MSELSLECPVLEIQLEDRQETIEYQDLVDFILLNDAKAHDKRGYLVSPMFGIAMKSQSPCWLTCLTKSALNNW